MFLCFNPIVTFPKKFSCRDLTLTSRINNISMLWTQDNEHILYVEVFTLVILPANVAEPQTKEGTHGYWSYPAPEQFCVQQHRNPLWMLRFLSRQSYFCRRLHVHHISHGTSPKKCPHCLWYLRKRWSKCNLLDNIAWFITFLLMCVYFLRSSWRCFADGFMKCLNLTQCSWNFNHVELIVTPSLSLACSLPEVYWVVSSNDDDVCVCVARLEFFFLWTQA